MVQHQRTDNLECPRNLAYPSLQWQPIELGNAAAAVGLKPLPQHPIKNGAGFVVVREAAKQQPCRIRRISALVRLNARVTGKQIVQLHGRIGQLEIARREFADAVRRFDRLGMDHWLTVVQRQQAYARQDLLAHNE